MSDALSSVVYDFEDLGEGLKLLPLAARRALDVVGFRLSLEGWQSLSVVDRATITIEGAKDSIDKDVIEQLVRKSKLPATRIKSVPDPDPLSPPDQLNSALVALGGGGPGRIEPAQWSRLRALDRFALLHVFRRSIAHSDTGRLLVAAKAIMARLPEKAAAADLKRTMRSRVPETVPIADPDTANDEPAISVAPFSEAITVRPRSAPPAKPIADDENGARSEAPLSHVDQRGEVRMVDVGEKPATARRAVATGMVRMKRETAERLARGDVPKGEVLATARIAGIQAAKRTPDLIPLCHTIALTRVEVAIEIDKSASACRVTATAEANDRTGVEMEALTATSVACLTIYDMLKAIDREMTISDIQLQEKSGGRTTFERVGGSSRRDG
jgi:cyclic pyranopterin phosphate synthase